MLLSLITHATQTWHKGNVKNSSHGLEVLKQAKQAKNFPFSASIILSLPLTL